MSLSSYITKRNGSARYYVRLPIPTDLQDTYGRREIWKSLGTASPSEAKALAPSVIQELREDFAARRHGRDLIETDIGALAYQHYVRMITRDEKFRENAPTEADLDEYWRLIVLETGDAESHESWKIYESIRDMVRHNQAARRLKHAMLTSADAEERLRAVTRPLNRLLEEHRIRVHEKSIGYRKLAMGVQRATLEALKRADERDRGEWGGTPSDPLIKPSKGSKKAKAGERIVDLYERFLSQQGGRLRPDTVSENRKIIQLFAEHVGETTPAEGLGKRHVAEFRDKLEHFPARARQTKAFDGLKFGEIIERNAKVGKPTLDPMTRNRYLSALGPFCRWLLHGEFVPAPIFHDEMRLKLDKTVRKRDPWSEAELKQIFASPLFVGCRSDEAEHLPGDHRIADWRYWLPLIALFSGMRLGEIAQLLLDDVREQGGIWFMHVTPAGDADKSVKTVGSERIVPVHSALIALGFVDYHRRMKDAGNRRLFPEITPDARGFMSGMPSKFFGTYFKRIGVKTDRNAMHSLRHNFADRLRRAGHLDQDFAFILGHGDRLQRTTGRYGTLPQGTLELRAKLVESVDYSEIIP